MSDTLKGILAMAAASMIWGVSGMFYKLLAHIPPIEVLSHRSIWSLVFFGALLILTGRLTEIKETLQNRKTLGLLSLAAIMISLNWFGFIYSIQVGWAMEASLGYYIFPLVAVALGFLLLGERFGPVQGIAIGLATLAVLVLSFGLGVTPWISLFLAGTFGIYGLLKRQVDAGGVMSVFIEVLLLSPLALIWLIGAHNLGWQGQGAFGTAWRDSLLLVFSGIVTGTPLVLFSYASKRLPYSTLGLIQYLNPTLQFLVAVLVFGESFTKWHAIAFPLIWIGLAIYSWEVWRQDKSLRNNSNKVGTSSTT